MVIIRVLLFPLAVLYDWITRLRNHLYTIGHKRSFRFETMVISVGNLVAGGSGKTPMAEYLIRLLQTRWQLATLSRGYGRSTKGIRFAGAHDNASTIGDEPLQFMRKFENLKVVVGEDRVGAIPEILQEHSETDIIILDDAYQHRSVDPQLSILLTDFNAPFYHDYLLPAGRLRESRRSASRADVVVVTKCPVTVTDPELNNIRQFVTKYAGDKPVFFSGLQYAEPVAFGSAKEFSPEVILVTGIAGSSLFESYATANFKVLRHFKFSDHHAYTRRDAESLNHFYKSQKGKPVFLTTEKDMVRLIGPVVGDQILQLPWFYIPIKMTFLKNGSDFDKIVIRSVETSKQVN